MTRGAIDRVRHFDRQLARWEVGPLSGMPSIVHVPIGGAMSIGSLALVLFGGKLSALVMLAVLAFWLMLAALDVGRGMWIRRHPYASRRWLNAVGEAVGEEVFSDALEQLNRRFRHDPACVVTRVDMADTVRQVRAARHDAARRSEGLPLGALPAAMGCKETCHGIR